MNIKVGTVDMTPTWAAAVEVYMAVLENGTEIGKEAARAEIRRLAMIADAVIIEQKEKVNASQPQGQ